MGVFQEAKPKRSHHAKPKPPVRDEKCRSIYDFYRKLSSPRVGHPAGLPPKKRGRPPADNRTEAAGKRQRSASSPPPPATSDPAAASSSTSVLGKRAAAAVLGVPLKRTNWGTGEPRERLTKAVEDWDAKTGDPLTQDPKLSLARYAEAVDIPLPTLWAYACADVGKRKVLGKSVGCKPLFDAEER